jgi:hypothetical protein
MTGSMPSACAVGSRTGTMTSRMVVPSRKQPRTRSRALAKRRNASGDSSYPFVNPASAFGTFSMVIT